MLKKHLKISLFSLTVFVGAISCQVPLKPNVSPESSSGITTQAKLQRLNFRVTPSVGFNLKQTAQAQAVKLEIDDGTQTYFANNVDGNGFATVSGGVNTISLTADVPEDKLCTVKLGFYSNASNNGLITEINASFRTPIAGVVDINQRTTITGRVVAEIRRQSPAFLTNLDLNALQAFVDGFLGLNNGTFTNLGLNNFSAKTPQDVDASQMATDIIQGNIAQLDTNAGDTAAKGTFRYRQMPYFIDAKTLAQNSSNKGLRHTIAATADRKLFMHNVSGNRLVGINAASDGSISGQAQTLFDINASTEIESPFLTTGFANHNGVSTPVFYYVATDFGGDEKIIARAQSDGSVVWSYNFDGLKSDEDTKFAPIVQNSTDPDCNCVADIIYMPHNTEEPVIQVDPQQPVKPKVLKIRSRTTPQVLDTYTYDGTRTPVNINGSGALSPDGSKLYMVNGGSREVAELIVLNTSDMSKVAITNLDPHGVYPDKSSPVVGPDGTVYLAAFLYNAGYKGAFLYAFNADGSLKWNTPFQIKTDARAEYSPSLETKNGKTRIFLHTNDSFSSTEDGIMFGIEDNGTSGVKLWERDIQQEMRPEPVLAEHTDGRSILITGAEINGKLYFIDAENGNVIESFYPGGSYTSGFALFDKTIFMGSNNLDRSYLRSIQYPIKGLLPASRSSWPSVGGGASNSGVPLN